MNIKLFVLLAVLSAQAVYSRKMGTKVTRTATVMASTVSGKQCMTGCTPYEDYHFCYTGWGSSNWEKCWVPDRYAHQIQYFTSMKKQKKPLCTSLCGLFGEDYGWCFTGEGGSWDYCTPHSDKNCHDCSKYTNGYQCTTSDGDLKLCSPDPIYYNVFDKAIYLLENKAGEFKVSTGFTPCLGNSRQGHGRFKRQYNEDDVRNTGVEQIANELAMLYNQTTFTTSPTFPITNVVTMTVQPVGYQLMTTRLPLVIRARIRQSHLINGAREAIPPFVEQQLIQMNRLPNDERGHLLAASLGGPSHDYNFAPQSTIVNRNYGGPSYWYEVETAIRNSLMDAVTAYIDWVLVVIYDDLQVNRRPLGFGVRFREFDEHDHEIHDSGNMYFSNDPAGGCII